MSHFRIRVLDTSRNVVWEQFFVKPPEPSREITFRAFVAMSGADDNQRLTLRLLRNPRRDGTASFRVSVTSDPQDLSWEDKRANVVAISNPWLKLAVAYHVIGDQKALDALIKHHPAAAAGIGDLYAAHQDWERAITAYRKAITDQSADGALCTKLATAYQSAGRTREAVPHLATLSAAHPQDTLLALKVAALQAWFGQDKEFAATRQRILASTRGTDGAGPANEAAKACCILPSADKAELEAALALGRTAVKVGKGGEWNLLALGMAEYRCGNDAAAEEALLAAAQAGKDNPTVAGISAFYRAMGLFRQGKPDEARTVALAAAARMKPLPRDENNPLAGKVAYNDLFLWLAYKEAKAMIMFDAAPPPKTGNDKQ
jgi:tetratricopeptide (TPR) repeat protein